MRRLPLAVALPCTALAIAAVLACGACVASNSGTVQSAAADVSNAIRVIGATSQMENAYTNQPYDLNPDDMLTIPGSTDVISINLNGGSAHELSAEGLADVRGAIAPVEQLGDCAFVFIDVTNGHGLAYNADEAMYVASAAKAPFVYHFLKTASYLSEYDRQNVEWIIVDSDNEAFDALFLEHFGNGYAEWMAGFDVHHDEYYYNFYPAMSARSLASIWADLLLYLQEGSGEARWFADLLGATTTSFIRDGVHDVGVNVMNKAGWIAEEDGFYGSYEEEDEDGEERVSYDSVQYRSVSDAAIIEADGRTYLMAIVTSQPDMGVSEANVSNLARALFDQRSAL